MYGSNSLAGKPGSGQDCEIFWHMQAMNTSSLTATTSAQHPLVSVVIPYYRQEAYLAEALESVEKQSWPNVEIIVVDDGSPVPAQSVIGKKPGVRIFRTPNAERSAARNFGFERSSGEFLLFLDADDRLTARAIEAHMGAFAAHPDAALVFGSVSAIDAAGTTIRPPYVCLPRKNYFYLLLETNPIASPGAALLRRDAFIQAGKFEDACIPCEDYQLFLRVASKRSVVRHDAWVFEYRTHGANSSADKERVGSGARSALDRLQSEVSLSAAETRRMERGRRRWEHATGPSGGLGYRMRSLGFTFLGVFDVSAASLLRSVLSRFSRGARHSGTDPRAIEVAR
jgi:hypothetical protein